MKERRGIEKNKRSYDEIEIEENKKDKKKNKREIDNKKRKCKSEVGGDWSNKDKDREGKRRCEKRRKEGNNKR